jgi:hypothetical protein
VDGDGTGLPSLLPGIANAQLPALYEAAKQALAQCVEIDECREWANRSEAMASYARQANDETLFNHARRIKARAVERTGELLKEIVPATGAHRKNDGADILSRKDAAREAGLSDRQRVTAIRVANIPKDQFEALVESDRPPSVDQLADLGKRKRPEPPTIDSTAHLKGRDPADFEQATRLIGLVRFINDRSVMIDLAAASRGADGVEREALIAGIRRAISWLDEAEDAVDVV